MIRTLGARDLHQIELPPEDVSIEKQQSRKSLALGRRAHFAYGGQIRHECRNLSLPHRFGVAFVAEENEPSLLEDDKTGLQPPWQLAFWKV